MTAGPVRLPWPGAPGPEGTPLAVGPSAPGPVRTVGHGGFRHRLWCLDLGLACCAVEVVAATAGRDGAGRVGVALSSEGPGEADVLLVSGTVTDAMAPAVLRLYEQMPERRHVVSVGSCANSGGPYWDSYCVTKGVDQILPVDVYVPGCPPRPEAVLQGLLRVQALVTGSP